MDRHTTTRATDVVCETDAGVLDRYVCLTAELSERFDDLTRTGRTDRMALRFEPTARVHWEVAIGFSAPLTEASSGVATVAETEIFVCEKLRDGEAVVDLCEVEFVRADLGLLVGSLGRTFRGRNTGERVALEETDPTAGSARSRDTNGHLRQLAGDRFAGNEHRTRAIGRRTAMIEVQRGGHLGSVHRVLERTLKTQLCMRVLRPVLVVLHRYSGEVLDGRVVLVEVRARHLRVDASERRSHSVSPETPSHHFV